MQKTKFKIQGIKCDNCSLFIEERLKQKSGIVKVKVDQISNKGVVIYDEQKINESDIYKIIEEIGGFKVEKIEDGVKNTEDNANYDNPSGPRDIKPPIEKTSNNRGVYAFIAVVGILFLIFALGPKNNGSNQVSDSVQNAPAQRQQQPVGNQQPQAPATVEKSDSPVLEAYVVTRCPYGIQMQRAMAEAIKEQPSLAPYMKVMYIGAVSGNTITAMHGPAEAKENLRQICIRDEQPAKYWDYVGCQMKSGDTAGCETSTDVDSAKLNACVSTPARGVAYAKKDFDLNAKYNISGSPTLILNGTQVSESSYGGRSSDGVKSMVCAGFNSQPSLCSSKLNTAQATVSFSATY